MLAQRGLQSMRYLMSMHSAECLAQLHPQLAKPPTRGWQWQLLDPQRVRTASTIAMLGAALLWTQGVCPLAACANSAERARARWPGLTHCC